MSDDTVRPWYVCSGSPCTCPKPAPADDGLPPRPTGAGWRGRQITEQTPSGWWVRRTEMTTADAVHIELFEPHGNKVTETVVWR